MSEQQLREFAEAAERRVAVPDLMDLTSRGRDLRRVRRAASAGALALVVAVGVMLSSVAREDRSGPDPTIDPAPRVVRELDARPVTPDPDLQPGQRYAVRPWSYEGRKVRVELTVPGTGWVWRGDGADKPLGPGAKIGDSVREPYAAVTVMAATRVIIGQCKAVDPRSTELAQQPGVAARQVAAIRGVRVEKAPTPTKFAGYPAVHLGLSVPRLCPRVNDIVLWGLSPELAGGHNGVASVTYAGQRMEVWLIDVDGTMLIVYSELSPGLPASFRSETQALLDSIVLTPVEN